MLILTVIRLGRRESIGFRVRRPGRCSTRLAAPPSQGRAGRPDRRPAEGLSGLRTCRRGRRSGTAPVAAPVEDAACVPPHRSPRSASSVVRYQNVTSCCARTTARMAPNESRMTGSCSLHPAAASVPAHRATAAHSAFGRDDDLRGYRRAARSAVRVRPSRGDGPRRSTETDDEWPERGDGSGGGRDGAAVAARGAGCGGERHGGVRSFSRARGCSRSRPACRRRCSRLRARRCCPSRSRLGCSRAGQCRRAASPGRWSR
jgi:hypothetical protein